MSRGILCYSFTRKEAVAVVFTWLESKRFIRNGKMNAVDGPGRSVNGEYRKRIGKPIGAYPNGEGLGTGTGPKYV